MSAIKRLIEQIADEEEIRIICGNLNIAPVTKKKDGSITFIVSSVATSANFRYELNKHFPETKYVDKIIGAGKKIRYTITTREMVIASNSLEEYYV